MKAKKPQERPNKSASVLVRLTPFEHERVHRIAASKGMRAVDYIRFVLRLALDAEEVTK
jgi:predicted DNA binding CopG/RHH family protein